MVKYKHGKRGKAMLKKYILTEEQAKKIEEARRKNKNKNVEKRLKALSLKAESKKNKEIAVATGFASTYIAELTGKYCKNGIEEIVENHYSGNHRNMSFEEEEQLLQPFFEASIAGQIIEVGEILKAYEEHLGRSFENSHGQIYYVLERHGWRRVMPRSRHPKKASEEAIEASKKLTKLQEVQLTN